MALPARGVTFGALGAALAMLCGCPSNTQDFGPPKPANVAVGGGPGAGGNGGSGGSGGSGGQTSGGTGGTGGGTTSTTTGTGLNACQCELVQIGDACGACTLDTHNPNGPCVNEYMSCESDSICGDLLNCPATCFNKPAAQQSQCIHDCFVNAANPVASVKLATAYLACACGQCAAKCQTNEMITCQ